MQKIIWEIPIKTVSEANSSEHWTTKSKRHKIQQFLMRQVFKRERSEIPLPCVVRFTRLSPKLLDDDNLRMAMKWLRDELSDCITDNKRYYINKKGRAQRIMGRNDSDPRIRWEYAQQACKVAGIRIEIDPI